MARKSRRTQVNSEEENLYFVIPESNKLKTAAYVRLSNEFTNTESVDTQIMMIHDYIDSHSEFDLVDTYTDVGVSGTTFDRPEFNRLMSDVQCGNINCIIVKDLSRFGRNYIEAGYYMETILPRLNVRLIAINDRFDSYNEEDLNGIQLPIKNMVNAMYAMDASKKFSESHDLHFKIGTYRLRTTMYGYLIDKEKNCYVPDPDTANIVKVIFQWYLLGYSMSKIAMMLNGIGAMIPFQAKALHENKKDRFADSKWNCGMVKRIIDSPTYTGDLVHNRRRHRMYTDEDVRRVEPNKWIVDKNTHEPLICHEVYNAVQIKKNRDKADLSYDKVSWVPPKKQKVSLFYKKLKCAKCGNTMRYTNGVYQCFHEKNSHCLQKVSETEVKQVVMNQIKKQMQAICSQKALVKSILDETNPKGKAKSIKLKIQSINRKLYDLQCTTESLYINLSNRMIDENDYKELSAHYFKEKEQLTEELKNLNHQMYVVKTTVDRFEDLVYRYEDFVESLNCEKQIIDEMVDSILIHKNASYEFVFRCSDVVRNFYEIVGEETL